MRSTKTTNTRKMKASIKIGGRAKARENNTVLPTHHIIVREIQAPMKSITNEKDASTFSKKFWLVLNDAFADLRNGNENNSKTNNSTL